jgi:acetylornithine deacetylase
VSPPCLTGTERAVLDALEDAVHDGVLARDLAELVRIPSVTGSAAELEALHWLGGRLEALGLDVDLWRMDLDELRARVGFPGTEAPRQEAWGLVATSAPREGTDPALVLQGHLDVVPPGDRSAWGDDDPFEPRGRHVPGVGDVVVGRGTCDMKAGVVANLAAVTALRRIGVPLPGGLAVHGVIGEEDGGLGAFGTLARGHRGAACVITEPTAGRVVTATAGALTFRLEVPGRAAHGSSRYEGVSAVDAFAVVQGALADLERARCRDPDPLMAVYPVPYPLSIGTVRSGDWASTVPDLLVAEGRYGVRLDETPEQARRAFEEAVTKAGESDPWLRDHPVRVTWWGGQFAGGRLPDGHPLLPTVRQAWADACGGAAPPVHGAPYGSDLRLYAAAGVATLHLGPGDVRLAHAAGEYVPLAEVGRVARAMALTALRLCGGPGA